MYKGILTLLLLAGLALSFVTLPALAADGDNRPPCCPGGQTVAQPGAQKDAATPEQKAAREKLAQEYLDKITPIKKELIVKETELQAQLALPKADEAKIASLAKEVGTLRGKLFEERVAFERKAGVDADASCCGYGRGAGRGHGAGRGYGRVNCPYAN